METENLWPHFKYNTCIYSVKSSVYLRIHLNFYSPFVAKLGKEQDDAQCRFCDEDQLQQEHEIIKCHTAINLFHKFMRSLKSVTPVEVDNLEMVVGIQHRKEVSKLRNFISFTIRHVIKTE